MNADDYELALAPERCPAFICFKDGCKNDKSDWRFLPLVVMAVKHGDKKVWKR
eukprot:gene23668-9864_t